MEALAPSLFAEAPLPGPGWVVLWLERNRPTAERRRQILAELAITAPAEWRFRYAFMLTMSVVIAVLGLVANSAAVVIGAMLVAPLMTPIMAAAAASAMGWPKRALSSAFTIVVSAAYCVGLAWLLTALVPDPGLTSEVLARTSPDLTDLLIALAAGAAGAYATVREDVATSLPGVAVAVALVPPLGSIGVTLEIGRFDLARGATLLFVTNLVAIVLSGLVVFVTTGFVPVRQLQRSRSRIAAVVAAVVASTTAVAVPLSITSIHAAKDAQRTSAITRATLGWLEGSGLDLLDIRRSGHALTVDVAGPGQPPKTDDLVSALTPILGSETTVQVRWDQRSVSSGDDGTGGEPVDVVQVVQRAVASWLGANGLEPEQFDVLDVQVDDDRVVVDLTGPTPPPSSASLADLLDAELGSEHEVRVRWTERKEVATNPPAPDDGGSSTARVRSGGHGVGGDAPRSGRPLGAGGRVQRGAVRGRRSRGSRAAHRHPTSADRHHGGARPRRRDLDLLHRAPPAPHDRRGSTTSTATTASRRPATPSTVVTASATDDGLDSPDDDAVPRARRSRTGAP